MHQLPLYLLQTSHRISQERRAPDLAHHAIDTDPGVIWQVPALDLIRFSSDLHLPPVCSCSQNKPVGPRKTPFTVTESEWPVLGAASPPEPAKGRDGCMLSLSEQVLTGQPQQDDPHPRISLHQVLRTPLLLDVAEAR